MQSLLQTLRQQKTINGGIIIFEKIFFICLFFIALPLYFFFYFPHVTFAIFILPTKFVALTQKVSLPYFLNPKTWLFVFIFTTIAISICKRQKISHIPKRLLFPYICFTILMLLSLYWTTNVTYGIFKVIEFVLFSSLACFAPFFLFKNITIFEQFLKSLIVVSTFLSGMIFIFQPYPFLYSDIYTSDFLPVFQTVLGGNYLFIQHTVGMAVIITLYYFLFKGQSRKQKILLTVLIVFFSAAIVYSAGKGSVLSILFTIIFMTITSVRFKDKKLLINKLIVKYGFLTFIISGLLIFTIGWIFLIRAKALLMEPEYYGRVERIENAKIALELFFNNPLFGIGIGGFSDFSIEIKELERFKYPHNIFLEVICELGLVGFIFFILMIGFALKQCFYLNSKYRYSKLYPMANVVFCLFVFTLLTSLTSGDINNIALFAWIGTAYAIERFKT